MKVYNPQPMMDMHPELKNWVEQEREARDFDANDYILRKSWLLNEYMRRSKLAACVVAVSGGIDSAVTLGLVAAAAKCDKSPIKRVVPVMLPCYDNNGVTGQEAATTRGRDVCEALGLAGVCQNINAAVNVIWGFCESIVETEGDRWALGQVVPYTRTPILYGTTAVLASVGLPAIVVGTTNFDEGSYLGYVGKASDGMVDVQLISDLHKSEVYAVAAALELPPSVMRITPTGDMYDGRADEEVFGAPYDFVEVFLDEKADRACLPEGLCDEAIAQYEFYSRNLESLHGYNAHKYIARSPAVHLDLWPCAVPGGWPNYFENCAKGLLEGLKDE